MHAGEDNLYTERERERERLFSDDVYKFERH